jgi:hypothetical protein
VTTWRGWFKTWTCGACGGAQQETTGGEGMDQERRENGDELRKVQDDADLTSRDAPVVPRVFYLQWAKIPGTRYS